MHDSQWQCWLCLLQRFDHLENGPPYLRSRDRARHGSKTRQRFQRVSRWGNEICKTEINFNCRIYLFQVNLMTTFFPAEGSLDPSFTSLSKCSQKQIREALEDLSRVSCLVATSLQCRQDSERQCLMECQDLPGKPIEVNNQRNTL